MTLPTDTSSETHWSLLQKIVFRFSFIFFGLYIVPFPLNYLPFVNEHLDWIHEIWNWFVIRAGKNMLHLSYDIADGFTGSGDTTWNYVQLYLMVIGGLAGTVIWSLVDRKRNNYQRLLYWFTTAIRYYLAFTLINYGSFKIFKSQFPAPGIYRLSETYGQSSPMGLAWTFLGFSTGFNYFMGFAELIGGLLLLFRKTKTFGALFSMTVTANIMVINYCFDVPVKIFSTILFLMAVFIAAPDINRLISFFIFNRNARLKSNGPSFRERGSKIIHGLIKLAFVAYFLYTCMSQAISYKTNYGEDTPKPKLYGRYQVETYIENKDSIPPLATDKKRWKKIILSEFDRGAVQMMNDTLMSYTYYVDSVEHEITLLDRSSNELKYTFIYSEPDRNHLELHSKNDNDGLYMKLSRQDPGDYLLMKRGFHWINEYPLNR